VPPLLSWWSGREALYSWPSVQRFSSSLRKTTFLTHFYIKTIILPKQARDKHRENSKKMPFFAPVLKHRPLIAIYR
jgi:hypothetical protein